MESITLKVIVISCLILVIHLIETLAYATRLSGARVGFIASAFSLFNLMVIVSRSANMIQQPFTGSLIDSAPAEDALTIVEQQYRWIMGAASLGTLIGILLLPTFVAVFSKAILHLKEEKGSIPTLVVKRLKTEYIKLIVRHFHFPKPGLIKRINPRSVSVRFLLLNMLVTSIYTISVLCALYAALIVPERSLTATMSAGLINGMATIVLVVFIDPKLSVLADEVVKKEGSDAHLRDVTGMLSLSRLAGTLFAQVLFIPGAYYIAWITQYFV